MVIHSYLPGNIFFVIRLFWYTETSFSILDIRKPAVELNQISLYNVITCFRNSSKDLIVTGGLDCFVKVWVLENDRLQLLYTLEGHIMAVVAVAVSPTAPSRFTLVFFFVTPMLSHCKDLVGFQFSLYFLAFSCQSVRFHNLF